MNSRSQQTILINVRGFKYEVLLDSFANHPNSRLGKLRMAIKKQNPNELSLLCDRFDRDLNEYYFNRDPFVLNMILNFYVTKRLHMNQTDCVGFLKDELDYWQIEDNDFNSCCQVFYHNKMQNFEEISKIEQSALKAFNQIDDFGEHFFPELR